MCEGLRRPHPRKPIPRCRGDIPPEALCGHCGCRRDQYAEFLPAPCLRGHPAREQGEITAAWLEAVDGHTGCRCLGFIVGVTVVASILRSLLVAPEGRAEEATILREANAAGCGGTRGVASFLGINLEGMERRGWVKRVEWFDLGDVLVAPTFALSVEASIDTSPAWPRHQGWELTPTGLVVARTRWAWPLAVEALRAIDERQMADGIEAGQALDDEDGKRAAVEHVVSQIAVERQRPGRERVAWEEALARLGVLAEMLKVPAPPP